LEQHIFVGLSLIVYYLLTVFLLGAEFDVWWVIILFIFSIFIDIDKIIYGCIKHKNAREFFIKRIKKIQVREVADVFHDKRFYTFEYYKKKFIVHFFIGLPINFILFFLIVFIFNLNFSYYLIPFLISLSAHILCDIPDYFVIKEHQEKFFKKK